MSTADSGVTAAHPPAPHEEPSERHIQTRRRIGAGTPQRLRWFDWMAIAPAFVGAFLLALSTADGIIETGLSTWLRLLGLAALLVSLVAIGLMIRDRIVLAGERDDWDGFARALPRGVRLKVPAGMNYAATFPPALDGLRDDADTRFTAGGEARHAILGAVGEIHFCVFQHHPDDVLDDLDDRVSTVGLVSLHPDREYDELPRLEVDVADPGASSFERRFRVLTADTELADSVLNAANRDELMRTRPFGWRIAGNQIITVGDSPRTPGQVLEFIDERIKPLAGLAGRIPGRMAGRIPGMTGTGETPGPTGTGEEHDG